MRGKEGQIMMMAMVMMEKLKYMDNGRYSLKLHIWLTLS